MGVGRSWACGWGFGFSKAGGSGASLAVKHSLFQPLGGIFKSCHLSLRVGRKLVCVASHPSSIQGHVSTLSRGGLAVDRHEVGGALPLLLALLYVALRCMYVYIYSSGYARFRIPHLAFHISYFMEGGRKGKEREVEEKDN